MNFRRCVWTLMLVVLTGVPTASAVEINSLRELIVLGLERNVGLQSDALNIPIAVEQLTSNEAVFDSELYASAGYTDASTPVDFYQSSLDNSESELWQAELGVRKKFITGLSTSLAADTEWIEDNNPSEDLDPRYRSALKLSLSQPLLRGAGKNVNTTDLQVAANRRDQSRLQYQQQAETLALQLELLAGQLAGQERIVALREAAVSLGQDLYDANRLRYDAGIIAVSEIQEAETALASRMLELSLAQQQQQLKLAALNRQLDHTLSDNFSARQLYPFSVEDAVFQLPEFESVFAAARQQSVVLQLAKLEIRTADLQADYQRNRLRPQLDLQLQASLSGFAGDERDSADSSSYTGSWSDSFASTADGDGYQWSAGAVFSMPLGNRAAKARFHQAELESRQAEYQYRDLEGELRDQLRQQTINLQRACEQVQIAARFESLAETSLYQEQRRLEEGLSDTFRIISFQDKLIEAQIGRVNALIQYYITRAQLNFARGIILQRHNIRLAQANKEDGFENM